MLLLLFVYDFLQFSFFFFGGISLSMEKQQRKIMGKNRNKLECDCVSHKCIYMTMTKKTQSSNHILCFKCVHASGFIVVFIHFDAIVIALDHFCSCLTYNRNCRACKGFYETFKTMYFALFSFFFIRPVCAFNRNAVIAESYCFWIAVFIHCVGNKCSMICVNSPKMDEDRLRSRTI